MRNFFQRGHRDQDVSVSVDQQVEQARRLVGIDDQELLTDPRTNPATRGRADALRTQQQLAALDQQHRRNLRKGRVRDARAAAAERTLEAIQAAREATSPGRAVASLTTTRTRYMVGCLVMSIVLSIGSGIAIEAWQQRGDDPTTGLGYIVEGGMTVFATTMIVLRGILAARNTKLEDWQKILFWLGIGLPLITSAILATLGSPIGAICSIGSAAWALAAYLATTSLSTAINDALDDVNDADESELRRLALDDDADESGGTNTPADRWISDQTDNMADQIEAFLADQDGPDTGGLSQGHTDPTGDGPIPRQSGIPTREEVFASWHRQQAQTEGHTVPDQHERKKRTEDGVTRTSPAIAARRATGQTNLHRVAEYQNAHPAQTVDQIADGLGLSPSTVKRHLRTLRQS